MSSVEICGIVESGIKDIFPGAQTVKIPIADGGEGTVDAFLAAAGGRKVIVRVKDPFFKDIDSFYGILPDGNTAVVEMAAASGLILAGEGKNPWLATTYGTGQLILDALDKGCRRIIIGIGGSATNDAGIGAAAALGVRFLDGSGCSVPLNGSGLGLIRDIDVTMRDRRLDNCEIIVACDVSNPLYGPDGAAYIFAPQKGADAGMVEKLDAGLRNFAAVVKEKLGGSIDDIPGTGAAGGLGASLIIFAGAKLRSGIEILLDTVKFEEIASDADLIITGEGKIDRQSLGGKVPVGIGRRAKKCGVPAIAIVGNIGDDIEDLYEMGINAVFSTAAKPVPFEEAVKTCREDLYRAVKSIMRFARAMKL